MNRDAPTPSNEAQADFRQLNLLTDISATAIRARYQGDGYVAYQAPRFEMLLNLVRAHTSPTDSVLDVGRTVLTELVSQVLKRPIDSLGFEPDGDIAGAKHFHFDLNHAQHRHLWRKDIPQYNVLIIAEVIEHLHTAPTLVLSFLRSLLKPRGKLLLQTPNAAALGHRLKLLVGRHPFEAIREDARNPGHFREYTMTELLTIGERSGFHCLENHAGHWVDCRFKFALQSAKLAKQKPSTLVKALHESGFSNCMYRLVPKSLRTGLTLVLQRKEV